MQHNTLWMQHNAVEQCILLAALMMISLLVALMVIDMNGPDIEAVDKVKALPRDEEHWLSTFGT
jgi:hypothetical protein